MISTFTTVRLERPASLILHRANVGPIHSVATFSSDSRRDERGTFVEVYMVQNDLLERFI